MSKPSTTLVCFALTAAAVVAIGIGAIRASAEPLAAEPLGRTVKWDPPTSREDGTALPIEELTEYRLYHLGDDGQSTLTATIPATAVDYPLNLAPDQCYRLTLTAVDTDGQESDPADPVQTCTYGPARPGNLRLTVGPRSVGPRSVGQ